MQQTGPKCKTIINPDVILTPYPGDFKKWPGCDIIFSASEAVHGAGEPVSLFFLKFTEGDDAQ